MAKRRLDAVLVDRGLFTSRERARAAVLAGEVRVRGEVVRKAGEQVAEDAEIEVAERQRYVSRGGLKLEGALDTFGFDVSGARAIDVGASTGGFTDCLLQRGAVSVVALDVGYGQLAWSLRADERVTVIERTNVRSVDISTLGAPFDVVVCDVSFISLATVLVHLAELAGEQGQIFALLKPQFEAGKGRVGKKGVVRDAAVHADVLTSSIERAHEMGMVVRGVTYSPIRGPEGNIEFWLWISRHGEEADASVESVVEQAHELAGGHA